MRKRFTFIVEIALVCLLGLAPTLLFSQSATTGLVTGVVTDPSGAVIPGAIVTLQQHGTGTNQSTKTGQDGRYVFPAVNPDDYTVTFAAAGFETAVVNLLKIEVLKGYTVNIIMKVGAASQTVTVAATTAAELQTTTATVGEVLTGAPLESLPTYTRSASALMFYQPAVSPGGEIAGARNEQITFNLDGGDITSDLEGNNSYAEPPGEPDPSPVIPIPVESTQEFQVATSNPNSTFARSSGGQVAMLTKGGTNQYHGTLYEYHNDDALNANGWTNDRLGISKPHSVDNRFGGTVGGPILKNKLFFFANYEGRRFYDDTIFNAVVPTATMKAGILQFPDATGAVDSYSFQPGNITTACGGVSCDPRNVGVSPAIASQLALYPAGNNPSLGDGLNTTGYTFDAPTPILENIGVLRLDYKISSKWAAFATYHYSNTKRTGSEQFSLLNSQSVATDPIQASFPTYEVTGQLTPTLTSVTHGSFLKDWWGWGRQSPTPLVPGLEQALSLAGEGTGESNSTSKLIADPVLIYTSDARERTYDGHKWYLAQDFSWVKGDHLFQFGGSGDISHDYFEKTDNYAGGLTTGPIDYIEATGNGSAEYLSIPDADRPATCAGSITTGCLTSSNVLRYNELYSTLLGLVDRSSQVETRNGDFQPNPLGTPMYANALIPAANGYFQDIWQAKRTLTLTLGLDWQVQQDPHESTGKYDNLVYASDNQPVDYLGYFQQRAASLNNGVLPGQAYNPLLGVTPVDHLPAPYSGDLRNTDWHEFGPRISAAWQVDPKTVVRGGYSVVYERLDNIDEVSLALTTGGLLDIDACGGPVLSGGVAQCTNGPTNPSDAFRIGVDGNNVPIPAPTAEPIPYVPSGTAAQPFGLYEQDGLDPFVVPGHDHSIDLTVQRELPGKMILEVGYIGRFSRNLFNDLSVNAADYLMKDEQSGQTYAQAFDGVAQALRNGTAVPDEPFFDNQIGMTKCQGLGFTNCAVMVAKQDPTDLIDGSLNLFSLDEFNLVTPVPVDNMQTFESFMITDGGYSNYNAGFLTLKKSFTNGLQFQFNWTLSHAIGNQGVDQQSGSTSNSPYNINLDRASESFDQRHVITAWFYDDLPIGKGRKLDVRNPALDRVVGGWFTSGIFTFATGTPMYIAADGDYGEYTSKGTAAICTANLLGAEGIHSGVTGSGGIGTAGDPAAGGTGMNLFADPAAIYNSCSRPLLSVESRVPFDELRAPSTWDLDYSIGKNIAITERYQLQFSAEMLNIFNLVNFDNPSLNLNSPTNFGEFTTQSNEPRRVLLALKFTF
ncbi:MAG: carboxypeptidase-like regulatory domain-containing protein [Candidatus Acidiferrales bacterium]